MTNYEHILPLEAYHPTQYTQKELGKSKCY